MDSLIGGSVPPERSGWREGFAYSLVMRPQSVVATGSSEEEEDESGSHEVSHAKTMVAHVEVTEVSPADRSAVTVAHDLAETAEMDPDFDSSYWG